MHIYNGNSYSTSWNEVKLTSEYCNNDDNKKSASDLCSFVPALVPFGERVNISTGWLFFNHVSGQYKLCTLAEALTDTDLPIPARRPGGQAEGKMHGLIFMSQ